MNASPNSLSAQALGGRFADHHGSPFIELRSIVKSFGPVEAIRNVSLTLRRGRVHTILGENGAGKSTLMKILAGVHFGADGEHRGRADDIASVSAQPNAGLGYEPDAIAAAVLGGTSPGGGYGTIAGTLIGALIIGVINNGMNLLSVPYIYQLIVKGVVILVAVCIDVQTKKRHG
jgi:energy-coupling factor transporter ATP-binding protein EcfA2